MRNYILLILGMSVFISCLKDTDDSNQWKESCYTKTELLSPEGYEVNTIGEIEFNGSVKAFQFVNEQICFALMGKRAGGYAEIFKTIDGGQTWLNLDIGINQQPRSMVFKDEHIGIITVHDDTGCPPPNCHNKCVILKTENGGIDWEEMEIEELKGILYHPKYGSDGHLYANLALNDQTTLMKSVDNGEKWDTLFSSPELDFKLITFSFEIFQDKLFVSAKDGKILVIDTNGQFIKTINVNDSNIWDVEIIDENNLIVVVSGKVLKSTNGGDTWETIYEESARMIGFESIDDGLMLLQKSSCPTDVYQVNDLIASTKNGGLVWIEADETTTNLRIEFTNSQRMGDGKWYIMIDNKLIELKEE